MAETIFRGLFDTETAHVISVADFMCCIASALVIGWIIAIFYMYKNAYSRNFIVTIATIPAIVCVVIMMVNGNVGAGVAVAGAFSLVRFRGARHGEGDWRAVYGDGGGDYDRNGVSCICVFVCGDSGAGRCVLRAD